MNQRKSQANYDAVELKLPSFQYAYRFELTAGDPVTDEWFTLNALFAGYYNLLALPPVNADRPIAGVKVKNISTNALAIVDCGGVQQLQSNFPGPPIPGFPLLPGETDVVTLDRLGAYALANLSGLTATLAIKFVAYEE